MRHLKPDKRGRICLGKLAKGVEYFCVTTDTNGSIILEPLRNIPEEEKWLYKNKKALRSVEKGLEDAKAGRLVSLGNFQRYLEEE